MRHPLLLALSFLAATTLFAQRSYTYTSVPGDPLETRIYTWTTAFRCG